MNAYKTYQSLSNVPWWARQSRKVRWAAARYYAGVDSLEQLRALTRPQPVFKTNVSLPILTEAEVETIVMLR